MDFFRTTVVWSFVFFCAFIAPIALAQAATAVGAPAVDPSSGADEWGNSFLWALTSSWLMRWCRENQRFSLLRSDTTLRVQRFIGAGIAFFNGLGITFVFDPDAGELVIGGLFLSAVMHGARQFLFQEFVYHSAIRRAPTA